MAYRFFLLSVPMVVCSFTDIAGTYEAITIGDEGYVDSVTDADMTDEEIEISITIEPVSSVY